MSPDATDPPVIGACLQVRDLPAHRAWLFDRDRDLELQDFFLPEVLRTEAWRDVVAEARRLLDGFGGRLGIHGPFIGLPLVNPDPDLRALVQARILTALDACTALGADLMVIHSPFTTWDAHNLGTAPDGEARRIAAVGETLAPVVARAAETGVTLAVENIEDADPGARRRLADALGPLTMAVSVDTGHAQYAHRSTGAPPVDYFLRDAGARLAHVHLQDADGHADRHWAIGRGNVPWHAAFAALAEVRAGGAAPRLVLELRDAGDIPASMAYLEAHGLGQ